MSDIGWPRPTTDLEYERLDHVVDLLGRILMEAAEVESLLREIAESLLGAEHGEVFIGGLSVSSLRDRLLVLIERRTDINHGLRAPLRTLVEDCKTLFEKRNDLAHGRWSLDEAGVLYVHVDRRVTKRSESRQVRPVGTFDDLHRLRQDFANMGQDLVVAGRNILFGDALIQSRLDDQQGFSWSPRLLEGRPPLTDPAPGS